MSPSTPDPRGPAPRLFLTCEHASNALPKRFERAFVGAIHLLETHRGFDPGSMEMARALAKGFQAPCVAGEVTRLLIDLNRSLDNPTLLSPWSAALPEATRQELLARYYAPFREATAKGLEGLLDAGERVVHLSVHSFTPVLRGQRRDMGVAFLFDPERELELELARAWKRELQVLEPRLKIAFNRPYPGTADGHTVALRRRLPPARYSGLELEINQRYPRRGGPGWQRLRANLVASLSQALATGRGRP